MESMVKGTVGSAVVALILVCVGGVGRSAAAQQEAELAKQLQNPSADLISVPPQNNWDFAIGSADAMRYTFNVQPVIPFSLTIASAFRER